MHATVIVFVVTIIFFLMLLAFRVWVCVVGVCTADVKLTFTLFDVYNNNNNFFRITLHRQHNHRKLVSA